MDSLQGLVDTVVAQTAGLPSPATLASWNPPLSGTIDIRIAADGSWIHEGRPLLREGLVRLFASLLRREADGECYLVTPTEKWRLQVERHALQVIDCEYDADSGVWTALLNTGGRCRIGGAWRLHGEGRDGEPFMNVPNGLTAQITRAAWYRLIDAAAEEGSELLIVSAGERISLGSF